MKLKQALAALSLLAAVTAGPALAQSAQTQDGAAQPAREKRGGIMGALFGQDKKAKKDGEQKKGAPQNPPSQTGERLEPDDTTALPGAPAEVQAGRRSQLSEEEAAVVPYYNNFLSTYRIGPEDVISVSVFGQDRYSKSGITVPPNGRISYPLISEGVFVAGKTTEQLQEELTKRLDEYIIDPQVTVSLDKAVSATYSVIGDVAQPGIRVMSRRYSILDALAMAGGVLDTGDKSKVFILRQKADGGVNPIPVNVKDIEKGKAKEMAFLVPGDQVVVPGNRLKTIKKVMEMMPIISFARIFTGGW